jgi:hypothetical protein
MILDRGIILAWKSFLDIWTVSFTMAVCMACAGRFLWPPLTDRVFPLQFAVAMYRKGDVPPAPPLTGRSKYQNHYSALSQTSPIQPQPIHHSQPNKPHPATRPIKRSNPHPTQPPTNPPSQPASPQQARHPRTNPPSLPQNHDSERASRQRESRATNTGAPPKPSAHSARASRPRRTVQDVGGSSSDGGWVARGWAVRFGGRGGCWVCLLLDADGGRRVWMMMRGMGWALTHATPRHATPRSSAGQRAVERAGVCRLFRRSRRAGGSTFACRRGGISDAVTRRNPSARPVGGLARSHLLQWGFLQPAERSLLCVLFISGK